MKTIIKNAQTIVIKIGSVLVADIAAGTIKQDWLDALAQDIKALIDQDKQIVVVSSGGVALGRSDLGIPSDIPPGDIPLAQKQAASSVGQYHMFNGYYNALMDQGIRAAQILLTISETENRRMYLNARETLWTLMSRGVVPVINENDTVSTEELRFGDNDRLAVRVAQMVEADLVILLSTTEGLYEDDPGKNPEAAFIPVVEQITEEHIAMAGEAVPGLSTGGMKSKVEAAQNATRAGIDLLITDGRVANSLSQLWEEDDKRATLFKAQDNAPNARKKWLQSHLHPKGSVYVDDGALQALQSGRSLLPIGVRRIEGSFERGDAIKLYNKDGSREIGIGLAAYSSADAMRIIGHRSEDVAEILGYAGRDELVHRNDMVLS